MQRRTILCAVLALILTMMPASFAIAQEEPPILTLNGVANSITVASGTPVTVATEPGAGVLFHTSQSCDSASGLPPGPLENIVKTGPYTETYQAYWTEGGGVGACLTITWLAPDDDQPDPPPDVPEGAPVLTLNGVANSITVASGTPVTVATEPGAGVLYHTSQSCDSASGLPPGPLENIVKTGPYTETYQAYWTEGGGAGACLTITWLAPVGTEPEPPPLTLNGFFTDIEVLSSANVNVLTSPDALLGFFPGVGCEGEMTPIGANSDSRSQVGASSASYTAYWPSGRTSTDPCLTIGWQAPHAPPPLTLNGFDTHIEVESGVVVNIETSSDALLGYYPGIGCGGAMTAVGSNTDSRSQIGPSTGSYIAYWPTDGAPSSACLTIGWQAPPDAPASSVSLLTPGSEQFLNMSVGQNLSFEASGTNSDSTGQIQASITVMLGQSLWESDQVFINPGETVTIPLTVPVDEVVFSQRLDGEVLVEMSGWIGDVNVSESGFTFPCSLQPDVPSTTLVTIPIASITAEICGANNDQWQFGELKEGLLEPATPIWQNNTLVIEYEAAPDYHIVGDTTQTLTDAGTECISVVPVAPTVTEVCGPNNDIVTPAAQPEGVIEYAASSWENGELIYTYEPAPGYAIADDLRTYVIRDADDCAPPGDTVVTPTPVGTVVIPIPVDPVVTPTPVGTVVIPIPVDPGVTPTPVDTQEPTTSNSGGGNSSIITVTTSEPKICGSGGGGGSHGGDYIPISNTTISGGSDTQQNIPILTNNTILSDGSHSGGSITIYPGSNSIISSGGSDGGGIYVNDCNHSLTVVDITNSTINNNPDNPIQVYQGGGIYVFSDIGGGGGGGESTSGSGGGGGGGGIISYVVPSGSNVTIWTEGASQVNNGAYATFTVAEPNFIDVRTLPPGHYRVVIEPTNQNQIELHVQVVPNDSVTALPNTGAGPQEMHPMLLLTALGIPVLAAAWLRFIGKSARIAWADTTLVE